MKAKRFWLRLFCQVVSLGLFFWLAWSTRYPLPLKGWGSLYFHLDPFLGLGASLASLRPVLQFWPALLLLALTFIWGRFFCWYLCPLGAAMDLSYRLFGRRFWPLKLKLAGRPAVQTGFLLVFLLLALFGFSGVGQRFDPLVICLGALLSRPGLMAGLLILIISLVFPRFWCFTLCPLGGLLEWTRRLGRRARRRDPAFSGGLTRRQFLGVMTAGVAAAAGLRLKEGGGDPGPRRLRPPGALPEAELRSACVRCGECLKVCPAKCLKPAGLDSGLSGLAVPHFTPREAPCELCYLCGRVCPSGAIQPTGPGQFKIGTARIDRNRCIAWAEGKLCLICMEYCPVAAIDADGRMRPQVTPDACVGCGACEKNCPVSGEAAIVVFREGERRGRRPGFSRGRKG